MSFQIRQTTVDDSVNKTLYIISNDLNILLNISISVGDYKYSLSGDTNGWLVCDGRQLLISDYPDLFDLVDDSFGEADEGYFRIPDFTGRVPGQIGSGSGLTTRSLGSSLGTETVTLSTSQMPVHNHTGTTNSSGAHTHPITDPGHTHTYLGVDSQGALSGGDNVAENSPRPTETSGSSATGITVDSAGAHTHPFTTDNTGGGLSHNNMQPTLFGGNVLIFAKFVQLLHYRNNYVI